MNALSKMDVLILVWFASAIVIEVASSFMLFIWLRYHGVRLVFGLTGVPGYMERKYDEFCRDNGRPKKLVLYLRALSIVNVVLAAIFAIRMFSRP